MRELHIYLRNVGQYWFSLEETLNECRHLLFSVFMNMY